MKVVELVVEELEEEIMPQVGLKIGFLSKESILLKFDFGPKNGGSE